MPENTQVILAYAEAMAAKSGNTLESRPAELIAEALGQVECDAAIMDGQNANLWLAILVAIGLGIAVGLVNGVLTAYVKLPPLVVTLAMANILQGIINAYTAGKNITGRPSPVLQIIAAKSTGLFPNILFILADDLGKNDISLYNGGAADGSLMWKHGYGGWGHCTQPGVFVVGDTVWTHVDAQTEYGSVSTALTVSPPRARSWPITWASSSSVGSTFCTSPV